MDHSMNGPTALHARAGTLRSMGPSRTERLLAEDFLRDLPARSIDEIRSLRAECQAVEVGLSYLRRLVQGRIDIVAAHRRRRAEGAEAGLASLVEDLPGILADNTHAPGPGRLPTLMAPSAGDEAELRAELDAVVSAQRIANLDQCDAAALDRLLDALTGFEREVSDRRRAVHERIDALQAELTRRYRTGEASVESLLER